ncbi:MAG: glycosyltransferase [Pirellulales bacterium]|nr:glycosyltransferase [Pirellulales bacterium]
MSKFPRLNVMHAVYSLETGGLENGVVNLCNRLNPERFAPSICVFRSGGALESRVDARRVKLAAAKSWMGIDPTLPFRLAWHLRRLRIDILHTHSWGTLVEGWAAAKMARTPIVIHGEHGVMEERPRNVMIQRWLWSKVRQVAAVSAPLADRMAQVVNFPRNRIQVIPNGVDTERFRPCRERRSEWRRDFDLPEAEFTVGMVARLVPVKNHLGMLQALALLKERGENAVLAIAGSGPLRESLQAAARDLNICDRVRFLGDIPQIERFLNALDAFVLNSVSEGMSNTVLEAMACGLPVVATAVGSNSLLLDEGKAGCLIPAENAEALARNLEQLMRDRPLREELGRIARVRVEKHFSIDRMVRDYEELYLRTAIESTLERDLGLEKA